jgi:beta-N-acetylhexosaminidase
VIKPPQGRRITGNPSATMTAHLDLGLRCIVEPSGDTLSSEEAGLLRELRPAGIMLRSRNFARDLPYAEWLPRYAELLNAVRAAIGRERIVVCVDHEGGQVHRFPPPITRFPYPAFYAASKDAIEGVSTVWATELKSLGINVTFSPCADIHTHPDNPVIKHRAYGTTPDAVASAAATCAATLRRLRVVPCAKHFPGHGDTSVDSHYALPVLNRTAEQLRDRELIPFKALIDDGLEMVMSAHLMLPLIDSSNQATLSPAVLRSLLRDMLGFKGVSIADALGMKAIRDDVLKPDFPRRAQEAGLDLFLMVGDPVSIRDAISVRDALRSSIEQGDLPRQAALDTQQRIEAFLSALPQYGVSQLSAEQLASHAALASTLSQNLPFEPFSFAPKGFD